MQTTQPHPATAVGDGEIADRFRTGPVAIIGLAHALHDTYTAFLAPLLPLFIERLSLTVTQAGALSIFMQAPSLVQPLIGHLADRRNLRAVIVVAPLITTTLMSLLGVAPGYGWLAAILLLVGISSSALHAIAPVLAGRLSGRDLGKGMGFWMVGGELGRTLGPLVVVTAVGWLTLEGMPWLIVLGVLGSLALQHRMASYAGEGSAPPRAATITTIPPHLARVFVPLLVIVAFRACAQVAITTYLPIYMRESGADLWLAGAALSVLEAAGVVGALVGGTLSDRLGRRVILAVSFAGTPVLVLAFMAASGWVQFPLLIVLGLVSLCTVPVLMALVQERFPEHRALANGLYMSLSFVIRSVAVLVVGLLADHLGLRPAFAISALLTLAALPAVWFLPKGQPQSESEPV